MNVSTEHRFEGSYLSGVDQLIGQALGNGLDVTESSLAGSSAQKPNSLVHSSKRGHIDGLSTDGTGTTDTGRVFTWTRVDDGIDQNLKRILGSQQVNDLEGVLHNANSHQLLAVVSAVHHHRVGETFHDWALSLAETLLGISACGVRQIAGKLLLDGDVILLKAKQSVSYWKVVFKTIPLTVNEMSDTCTSVVDQRPNNLISSMSGTADATGASVQSN